MMLNCINLCTFLICKNFDDLWPCGKGICPCCKNMADLTEHHDHQIDVKVMICRSCHDIIEAYIKTQNKIKNSSNIDKND